MLDNNEELPDRVKQLEDKLEALQRELEESYEDIDDLREAVENEGEGFTDVQHGKHNFQVHWIRPEETESYPDCAAIDNIEKARIAFKEAAIKRDSSDHLRPVNQGDILFLMCDTAPEPEPDPDNPDGTPPDVPACSFIGMCAKIDFRTQLENPDTALGLTQSQLADGDPYREFFAWDSCGGSSTTNVECDKTEQYITVVTDTKTEVESTGVAPEKTHTIKGYHKTRRLRFDECGTLDLVEAESDWEHAGDTIIIKECCDDPGDPSNCNPPANASSVTVTFTSDPANTNAQFQDIAESYTLTKSGCTYSNGNMNISGNANTGLWTASGSGGTGGWSIGGGAAAATPNGIGDVTVDAGAFGQFIKVSFS